MMRNGDNTGRGSADNDGWVVARLRAESAGSGVDPSSVRSTLQRAEARARRRRRARSISATIGAAATGVLVIAAAVSVMRSDDSTVAMVETDVADEPPNGGAIPALAETQESAVVIDTRNGWRIELVDLASGEPVADVPTGLTSADGVYLDDSELGVWVAGRLLLFDRFDVQAPPREIVPDPLRHLSDSLPNLHVAPVESSPLIWLVQPGESCCGRDDATLIELVDGSDGTTLFQTSIPQRAIPVRGSEDRLVLDSQAFAGGGAEPVVEDGPPEVLGLDRRDGNVTIVGVGEALGVWGDRIAYLNEDPDVAEPGDLVIANADGSEVTSVAKPASGRWAAVDGPVIPSNSGPLPTVSDTGELLVALGRGHDENGIAAESTLVSVDLQSGRAASIFEFGAPPDAAWTSTGLVTLLRRQDIRVLDPTTSSIVEVFSLADGQFAVAIG